MRRSSPTKRVLSFESLEIRLALATFYVSTAGSDSQAGSTAAPWQTLQKAANSVQAGDTVIVRPGNYVGFDLRTDGTASGRIIFKAEAGAAITSRNAVTADGINLEGADYVTIEGFTINGMPRAGIRSVTNHHVTIRGNSLDNNSRWGIFTGFSDDLLIENNVSTRAQIEHGIYVSNSGDRPVIRNNMIWGNRANGIHMNGDVSQGGDGIISGALVEGNVIYDNGLGGGSGINADGVQNSRFQNNLLYNNHASGISLYMIDGAAGSTGNVVVNNTILQASNGRWNVNIQNGSTGNTVMNNILYSSHTFRGVMDISSDSLPGFLSDYNVVMNRFTTNGGDSIQTLAQWRTSTGQDQHSLLATPSQLFVDTAGNNYHLSASNPAIDAGTPLLAPPRDFESDARPSGAGWDIGADERVSLTPNQPPVAVDDSATTPAGSPADIFVLANDQDPESASLSVGSFSQPAQGTVVTIVNGGLRYTPAAGFSGTDTFTYQASDGSQLSNVAIVRVTVEAAPVNRGPTGILISGTNVAENSPSGKVIGTLSADDPDSGDTHTFTLPGSAGGRFAVSNSKLVVANGGLLNYESARSHQVVIRATDSGGLSVDQAFTINVTNVNEVIGFDVQRGALQRSYIRYVDLIFESATGLSEVLTAGRMQLAGSDLNGAGNVAVSLTGRTTVSGNRVLMDFGSQGIGGSRNSAKGDGYYRLSLDADGDGSLETRRNFYRLLGDANRDRTVDSKDSAVVMASYGARGSNHKADLNGDGVVNSTDLMHAQRQAGRKLRSGLPIDD
ncbi:MAG: right-handed parallel beta-helix repeat-containing protein [Pirellulaceae bacterium]|nr:right-handed parallel beta-helix repeat-containing protein [Pirellulaceae bacterium]